MIAVAHRGYMMTQQLRFSVLTAPLAAIDRRALSQAWYSALHLATQSVPPERAAAAHPADAQRATQPLPARRSSDVPDAASSGMARAEPSHAGASAVAPLDRRTARSSLARKIERTFLHPRYRVARASFTLEGSHARVHVALQSRGDDVRLVAVCAPHARTAVANALAQARYALARRGITLRLQEETPCL